MIKGLRLALVSTLVAGLIVLAAWHFCGGLTTIRAGGIRQFPIKVMP